MCQINVFTMKVILQSKHVLRERPMIVVFHKSVMDFHLMINKTITYRAIQYETCAQSCVNNKP